MEASTLPHVSAFYLKEGFQVDCLHIAFGQPSSPHEQVAARRVTRHYGVPLSILRWAAATRFTTGEIVGRNAFMCLGALLELGDVAGVLAIGIHAGTPYYDCSRDFVSDMQRVIDGYCDGRLRLGAPFVEWSKRDVYGVCPRRRIARSPDVQLRDRHRPTLW